MKRVPLIRLSSLGDVVLTSALFEPLTLNGFKPILITFEPYGGLFSEDPRVEVVEIPKKGFFKNLLSLKRDLQKLEPFAVLDLHSNPKSWLLKKLLKAPVKVSYDKRSLFRRFCVLLNRFGFAEGLKEKPFSVVNAYADTLKGLGIEVSDPRPKILLNDLKRKETLKKFSLEGKKFVVLGVGARYKKKLYPHFKELSKLLRKEGFEVVLIGDKKDLKMTESWKSVINLCGKLSLIESLHILSGAVGFIGNDSGATHMARAVGTKVLTIFGGTHPCLGFAPFPDEGAFLKPKTSCSPCDLHGKGKCGRNYECIDHDPKEVLEKFLTLIGQNARDYFPSR